MVMLVITILAGIGAIAVSIAVMIEVVVHRLRGRPGRVASTRAGKVTSLLAASVALCAALALALGPADSSAGNPFLAKYGASGLIVAAAIFIWDVARSDRASRRGNTPPSPPDA